MNIEFHIFQDYVLKMIKKDPSSFFSLIKLFNHKAYKASDTDLTYRQISHINKNILEDQREDNKGWRKFSLKEIAYLSIIQKLRTFGLKDKQLDGLKNSFFTEENSTFSDIALILVLQGVRVDIIIDEKTNVYFVDAIEDYAYFRKKFTAHLNINFNKLIKNSWKKFKIEIPDYRDALDCFQTNIPSKIDKKMLDLVNRENYSEFFAKTKNNNGKETRIITGKKRKRISEEEVLKLINQKFTTVTTKKEDTENDKLDVEIIKTHKL